MGTKNLKCPRHGMSKTRFNATYRKIRQRCITGCCPEAIHYKDRGIKCLWESFENFRDDMYESYLEHSRIHGENNTTIERIDNNGDYCKENCKWATMKEQCNNRRNNIIIKNGNTSLNLTEWSEKTGIKYSTIRQRIFVYGWSIEKALATTKH